ncbi:MAG TPA: hypothetical protein VNN80_01730 [Polyangiaceae bacterium]|nr:hypothetical protein [Polyangiaceae bacterium]
MSLGLALLGALAACNSSRSTDSAAALDEAEPAVPSRETCADNSLLAGCETAGGTPGPSQPPPEVEREDTYRAPVVTGRYVWSANPGSGRVAAIDATTLEIRSGEAGNGPSVVAGMDATGAPPRALVINSGADDASLLELTDTGIGARHVPLHQGADSWSLSPDGRFAIAWTDRRKAVRLDDTDGLQDITVLELGAQGELGATRLSVGYRPSAIAFDAQSRRAFAVTEDGISVVELEPGAVRLGDLVPLPSTRRIQPDVSITADGSRALARLEGSSSLYDIDLSLGQTREIPLGGVITDLDLSADGSRAVAVIRSRTLAPAPVDAGAPLDAGSSDGGVSDAGTQADPGPPPANVSEAVFIPVPAGLTDAGQRRTLTVPGGNFGSVSLSPDGSRAVLFSTGLATGVVTLVGPDLEQRSVDLIAPVRAVFVTADSAHALALQDPPAGSVKKGAFSVLSLANVRAPKRVATDAPAELVALDPATSERAIVTVSDPGSGLYGAYFVRMPSLQVDFLPLPSRPLSSGVVPAAGQGFVSQQHPEGRITFISLDAGVSRMITGFELSAKVVNE